MRRHWLVALIGFCMLGLAARSGAGPMTATQVGEVTEILNPEFAGDYVVGATITMVAEWDTDDLIDLVEFGFNPGFFELTLADNPDSSLTITIGGDTWIETDDFEFGEFLIPYLLFDSDGDFLGARFAGTNSDGLFFGTFVLFDLFDLGIPPGRFLAGSSAPNNEFELGVVGFFEVPEFDGVFPTVPVAEPGRLALLGLGLFGLGLTRRRAN